MGAPYHNYSIGPQKLYSNYYGPFLTGAGLMFLDVRRSGFRVRGLGFEVRRGFMAVEGVRCTSDDQL